MYQRTIEDKIKQRLFSGKVICIFGPRRSGKTTLVKKVLSDFGDDGYYLNCEDAMIRGYLVPSPKILKDHIGNKKIVVLDEAQTIEHIGLILKVFVDTYPEIQIIATGSSSFELANRIGEPLVGRAWNFFLSPLSFKEIFLKDSSGYEIDKKLNELLVFGSYPQVVNADGNQEKTITLGQIANNYLYKDIFTFEQIKKPKILEDLLKAVALQVGNEVSITELSRHLDTARPTIERYLQLLEKTFVIKRIYSLKRNRRDEIKSNFKIYFYDNGIRNYIINALNPIDVRNDVGQLFENYFVMERVKYNLNNDNFLPLIYFWRTHSQLEIDYIEESNGKFFAYECKYTDDKAVFTQFLESYPNTETFVVNKNNLQKYLM